jgi:dihydropyrimidinase
MKYFDTVIRNGLIVNFNNSVKMDVGIKDGKVVQLGGQMDSGNVIQAEGNLVLPGGVDAHVHLSPSQNPKVEKYSWVDDFYVGSQAAIAGGVTTIGNMTFPWTGQSLRMAIKRDLDEAKTKAAIDYFLHPVLTNPSRENLATIIEIATEGFASIKIFQSAAYFNQKISQFMEAIKEVGKSGMVLVMHCEDANTIRKEISKLTEHNNLGTHNWAKSRPILAETKAIQRAIEICESTKTPIYAVHVSSNKAISLARSAKQQGIPFLVETRPMYLHLTEERLLEKDGAKYIGAPPLRTQIDLDGLWVGLQDGTIDTVASDHAPFTLEAKLDKQFDVKTAKQGISDLETALPMLFFHGVIKGKISVNRFVELTSTNPAKIFGLWPRKGTISIGADADIVIWDIKQSKKIIGSSMYSNSRYSVYEGEKIVGTPVLVMSRGEVLMRHGVVSALAGRGKWIVTTPRSQKFDPEK